MLGNFTRGKEEGANLVEFAVLAPLLVLLLLGTVEFGWGLAQQIDVRHKAREALRMAIVDDTESEIVGRVCNDSIVDNDAIAVFVREGSTTKGEAVTVTISADIEQLTGFFGWLYGPDPTISSTVEGRVEQEPDDPPDASSWLPNEDLAPQC